MASKPDNEPKLPRFKVQMFSTKTLGETGIQKAMIKDLAPPAKPVKISNSLPKK
jgi:hypothetical protein